MEFAREAGIVRQTLLKLRDETSEACMSTVGQIVRALRRMTGKRYRAQHVFDVAEELPENDPLRVR